MYIGELIKAYRKNHGLSLRAFAEKCDGVSHGYLAALEKEKNPNTGKPSQPSIEKLEAIARGMDMPLDRLLFLIDNGSNYETPASSVYDDSHILALFHRALKEAIPYTPPKARVPIVGSVRCGPGGLAYQELQGSELADVANPSEYFYLRAEGDSMLPDIRPGDLVLVHIQPEVDSGQLAVVTIDGEEGALKKFIQKDNAIILQSFNQAYPPRVFVGEEMTAVNVCGRVVETKRKW